MFAAIGASFSLKRAIPRFLTATLFALLTATVRGQPATGQLKADLESLNFGAVRVGKSFEKSLTLRYKDFDGRGKPVSLIISVDPPFQVSPTRVTLRPGQRLVIKVVLPVQQAAGSLEGAISIRDASPNAVVLPTLEIPVNARVAIPKNGHTAGPKPSPPLWNSWIRRFPEGAPVEAIEPEKDYSFRFDLAAFDYTKFFQGTASAGIDIEFDRELASIPDSTTEVLVIPVILGHGLKFIDGEQVARRVTVDLDRLRHPPENWSKEDPLPVFADKVNALKPATDGTRGATIGVRGTGEGCAAVALTIWRSGFNRPLDHVVRQVGVAASGASSPCSSEFTSSPLKSGLLSLLALPFEQRATAALHVFETRVGNADLVSAAIFLKEGDPPEILSWNPSRSLSAFVGKDEAEGLRRQIQIARCGRKENGQCFHDYSTVAAQLRDIVFQDDAPKGQKDADRAKAVLQELSSGERPDIFVRLVSAEGKNLFLPIGLLGLGTGDLLGRKANLVTPMPKEKAHDPARCIASWKMVLPKELAEVDQDFLAPVGDVTPGDLITDWTLFKDYAALQEGPKKGEGLVLLAHHGGGLLSFDPQSINSLQDVQFKHPYPGGGVAILAGCSVGQLVGDNKGLPLLTRMNDLGVSAVVLSPFDVQGKLGARFAMHFANEIDKARKNGEEANLQTLFQRTQAAVRGDDLAKDVASELDEFLLVGDGRVQLCPKGGPQ